jgi:hypothetical protein
MSYQPIVPTGGLSGWRYLQRTIEAQQTRFADSAVNARDIEYFRANIAQATTPEKLVSDRVLLKVALGAFGLSSELDKKAFIRKVLEEGTTVVDGEKRPFAMRLADPKYRDLAAAFGYGDEKGAQVTVKGFADDIAARYRVRAFEEAVGAVDNTMRLALNFEREMARLAKSDLNDNAAWLRVVGDVPMRSVFERAFNLPQQFATLDVDRQAAVLRERSERILGSKGFKSFAEPEARDAMLRRFFVQEQVAAGPSPNTRGMAALAILQAGQTQTANLLFSRF